MNKYCSLGLGFEMRSENFNKQNYQVPVSEFISLPIPGGQVAWVKTFKRKETTRTLRRHAILEVKLLILVMLSCLHRANAVHWLEKEREGEQPKTYEVLVALGLKEDEIKLSHLLVKR